MTTENKMTQRQLNFEFFNMICAGDIEGVKRLIAEGADVNFKVYGFGKYHTAFSMANERGYVEIVELLKKHQKHIYTSIFDHMKKYNNLTKIK
jgi:hypothetical protein